MVLMIKVNPIPHHIAVVMFQWSGLNIMNIQGGCGMFYSPGGKNFLTVVILRDGKTILVSLDQHLLTPLLHNTWHVNRRYTSAHN